MGGGVFDTQCFVRSCEVSPYGTYCVITTLSDLGVRDLDASLVADRGLWSWSVLVGRLCCLWEGCSVCYYSCEGFDLDGREEGLYIVSVYQG